jgi:hypothetical protein
MTFRERGRLDERREPVVEALARLLGFQLHLLGGHLPPKQPVRIDLRHRVFDGAAPLNGRRRDAHGHWSEIQGDAESRSGHQRVRDDRDEQQAKRIDIWTPPSRRILQREPAWPH